MDQATQQRYLQQMGITVWRHRASADASEGAVEKIQASAAAASPLEDALDRAIAEPPPAVLEQAARKPSKVVNDVARMDWDSLENAVKSCTACQLCQGRSQAVFGVGVQKADLMVIGEGPGAEEDRQGLPFVGPAGQLLDAMLKAINYARYPQGGQQGAYIANIVKCRPPNNRDPLPDEAMACRDYLERQIALVQPRLILAVGRVAAQNLLGSDAPLGRLRGSTHRHAATGTPILVTYHPAYLLRSPGEKRKAWEDLKQARNLLQGEPAT